MSDLFDQQEHKDKLTPQEYFDYVKGLKREVNDTKLDDIFEGCLILLNKQKATGQIRAAERTLFMLECIVKERELVKKGFTTFVYRDDIDEYVDRVADKAVKLIELKNYIRDIPDEVVEAINSVKDIFDEFFVIFTDYTGKEERRVEKERQAKDPIVFGAFIKNRDGARRNNQNAVLMDRFYYIGDWEDEYCDLTFDKMVDAMNKAGHNIERTIKTPEDVDEFKSMVNSLIEKDGRFMLSEAPVKKSFFKRVQTALKVLKGGN